MCVEHFSGEKTHSFQHAQKGFTSMTILPLEVLGTISFSYLGRVFVCLFLLDIFQIIFNISFLRKESEQVIFEAPWVPVFYQRLIFMI